MLHPNEKTSVCPSCGQNCDHTAAVDVIHTTEVCNCKAWEYPHLVETSWHKQCFVNRVMEEFESVRGILSAQQPVTPELESGAVIEGAGADQ